MYLNSQTLYSRFLYNIISLQHLTLLSPPDTSTTEHCFHFVLATLFFLELLVISLHSSPVTYWTPSNLKCVWGGAHLVMSYLLPFSYWSGAPLLFCLSSFMSHEIPTFFHFFFLPPATFTVYSFILIISLQNTHPPHCPLISPTLLFSSRFYFSQSLCLLTPLAHTFRVGGMQ